jgi:hypothetical protein
MSEPVKQPAAAKCPICGGLWWEGECYKCGAYLEDGKVVPPKPGGPPAAEPPATTPVLTPAPVPKPIESPGPRPWDTP